MNYFSISQEDLQKVANYLASKPWSEVNSLIQILSQVKPVASTESSADAAAPVAPDTK